MVTRGMVIAKSLVVSVTFLWPLFQYCSAYFMGVPARRFYLYTNVAVSDENLQFLFSFLLLEDTLWIHLSSTFIIKGVYFLNALHSFPLYLQGFRHLSNSNSPSVTSDAPQIVEFELSYYKRDIFHRRLSQWLFSVLHSTPACENIHTCLWGRGVSDDEDKMNDLICILILYFWNRNSS